MEGDAEFHDWEILLRSEAAGEDLTMPLEASKYDSEDGAIKSDYFVLDFYKPHQEGPALAGEAHEDEVGQVDSDNLSWVDPESDSRFLDRPKGEVVGFPGIEFPRKDLGRFWLDESSDGGGKKGELGDAGGLEIGESADGDEEGKKEMDLEGTGDIEAREMEYEKPGVEGSVEHVTMTDENYNSSVEMGDKNIESENNVNVLASGGEKRGVVWWKLPFELLKFCAFRVKPVWSVSIAAAILGIWMLGKRLYRMKQKARSIPLKLGLDEKKAFQLKIQAAHLNDAFTVARRVPIIRASLRAGGMTPRSVVGLQ